jgi:uncharacterized membrane protein YphA (DoxX/SURF4 family)
MTLSKASFTTGIRHGILAEAPSRYLPSVARITLGATFFVCGLGGFLNVMPPPSGPMPRGAMAFGAALIHTGYMFPLITATEVIAGALLLANRFVPLALALLAPVVVNIFAFHAFLAPAQLPMATLMLLLVLRLSWAYRAVYAPMLTSRAQHR